MTDLPPEPPTVLVHARSGPVRCAVCHDELAPEARARNCLRCGSAAHEECRAELDGCPTLACPDRPVGVRLQRDGAINVVVRLRRGRWRWPSPPVEALVVVGMLAILLITAVTSFRNALNNTWGPATRRIDSPLRGPINQG